MAEFDDKLETTLHGKVSIPVASRMKAVAEANGLKDSQLVRLIILRADELFRRSWRPHMNVKFLLDQLEIRDEQLNLFFVHEDGSERSER